MTLWNNLSMRERAGFIKIGLDNGLTSLDDIHNAYNNFAQGGHIYKDGGEEGTPQKVKNTVKTVTDFLGITKPVRDLYHIFTKKSKDKQSMQGSPPADPYVSRAKTYIANWVDTDSKHDLAGLIKEYRENTDNFFNKGLYYWTSLPEKMVPFMPEGKDVGRYIGTNLYDSAAVHRAEDVPILLSSAEPYRETSWGLLFNKNGKTKEAQGAMVKDDGRSFIFNALVNYFGPYVRNYDYTESLVDTISDAERKNRLRKKHLQEGAKEAGNKIKNKESDPYIGMWEYFKTGRYNSGDPEYYRKVKKDAYDMLKDPYYVKWLLTQTYHPYSSVEEAKKDFEDFYKKYRLNNK